MPSALQRARTARNQLIAAELAAKNRAYRLPALQKSVTVAEPITGTVVTGPDGFFAFPVDTTGRYWLRAEKDGYTYGQRDAEIVKERSLATNAIYLTPIGSGGDPMRSGRVATTPAPMARCRCKCRPVRSRPATRCR